MMVGAATFVHPQRRDERRLCEERSGAADRGSHNRISYVRNALTPEGSGSRGNGDDKCRARPITYGMKSDMTANSETLRRLLAISRSIAGQLDYESVLGAFHSELNVLLPHDHVDIVLLSPSGADHYCYEVGVTTSWGKLAHKPMPTAMSPVRSVLWGKVPFYLSRDALTDERFHFPGALDDPIFAAGLMSRIIVPLRVQARIIGSLNVSRQKPDVYDESDVEVAKQSADLIAPYLHALMHSEEARKAAHAESAAKSREEMLRTGALRLTEGMENERRRLAMDLHDQTLADLARLSRAAARLRGPLQQSTDVQMLRNFIEFENELESCLNELRRIIDDLRPGILELFGFVDAVEEHLGRCVRYATPPIHTRIEDRASGMVDALDETTRIALYRIIQEASNNAARHSGASEIGVTIDAAGDRLRIEVSDDGSGCALPQEGSGGMSHMRTRAALISADISIVSSPEAGSRVTVCLPLPKAASPSDAAR